MPVTPNSIVTPQTPRANVVNVAAANATYSTSPTNTQLLVTAGPNGARLTKLQAIPCETITSANQLQVFRSADGGTTRHLADSALMGVYTMAQTTEAPTTDFGYSDDSPVILQPNERLYVAEGQAKSVNFIAEWADY
ncbi:hypothetical protein [Phenylobacterium kunshanense]|uniref:Uncharacterized protein n=1 Tax=Phenylobacterium kunshanense TaxID=1445034 RepID=A0A328B6H9_9CAUL|nr:hypothetical protein [Phenylobacterium kunshanense]RAK63002.1 hypothetical protein DJ019_17145 [Phenylobacterium kunshanense]